MLRSAVKGSRVWRVFFAYSLLLTAWAGFDISPEAFAQTPDQEAARIRKLCEEPGKWSKAEVPLSHPLLTSCLNEIDNFGLGDKGLETLSRSQKSTSLLHLESLLEDVRKHSQELREAYAQGAPSPTSINLSESVLFEHALRRALSRIRAVETWEAGVTAQGGAVTWGSRTAAVAGMRAFLSIDLGQNVGGFAELETMSVRREGLGALSFPLESSDLLGLSQLWVRSERLRRLHFWIGVKPDEDDPVAPRRWAFFSLGGLLNLGSAYRTRLDLNLRHDRFAFWDVSQDLFEPGRVERNLSALELHYAALDKAEVEISMLLRGAFHWYADPGGALRRLSLGRNADLVPEPQGAPLFRVLKADAQVTLRPLPWLLFEPSASFFRNVETTSEDSGKYIALKSRIFDGKWAIEESIHWSDIGCEAMPPVGLHHTLFPGTTTQGAGLRLIQSLGIGTWSFELFAQDVRAKEASRPCSWQSGDSINPHLYHVGAVLAWTTSFSPAN